MKLVLENLGFESLLVPAEVTLPDVRIPWNHAVTIVKFGAEEGNSSDEKTYLIDIGFPRPIAGPVNLSSLPYQTTEGGYEVEVRFNAEKNQYERVLLNGCPLRGPMVRCLQFLPLFCQAHTVLSELIQDPLFCVT